jgi:hypothetical protein
MEYHHSQDQVAVVEYIHQDMRDDNVVAMVVALAQ